MKPSRDAALRRAVNSAPCSARQLALQAGIDPSLLTRFMGGEKGLSDESADNLATALEGWSRRCAEGARLIRVALTQNRRH